MFKEWLQEQPMKDFAFDGVVNEKGFNDYVPRLVIALKEKTYQRKLKIHISENIKTISATCFRQQHFSRFANAVFCLGGQAGWC